MKIAYSHQIFTWQRYGGISRYFTELAINLADLGESPIVFAGIHQNQYLQTANKQLVKGYFFPSLKNRARRLRHSINDFYNQTTISNWKPDIIHETFYHPPALRKIKIPRITTVYDMIYELYPEFDQNAKTSSSAKRDAVKLADHVICISHSTKQDLIRLFGTPSEKISVVHLGCNMSPQINNFSLNFTKPYLLFVGNRVGIKNFDRLIEAFSKTKLHKEYNLILFGGGNFTDSEKKRIYELGLNEDCVRVIQGNDHVLEKLYINARALIYPSLYEGFGLPPLEAMAMDCPVASSNTSSMPEVIGSAGEYFDPTNIDEMVHAINVILTDEARRADLIKEGKNNIQLFSWKKTAEKTSNIYRSLL